MLQERIAGEIRRLGIEPVNSHNPESIRVEVTDNVCLWRDTQFSWFHRADELLDELEGLEPHEINTYSDLCNATEGSLIGESLGGDTDEVQEARSMFDGQWGNIY